ncbi:MAG TPA: hypothetical protein QGF58_30920 [Myxococcota bacterium]|nr:hypothetical protein [Myxococcota bacterium]
MTYVPIDIVVHRRDAHALRPPHAVLPDIVVGELQRRYGPKLVVMRGRGSVTAVFAHRVRIEVSSSEVVCHYYYGSSPKSRDLDLETVRGALAACCLRTPVRRAA